MLIYHPLTDVYNCINRYLLILNEFKGLKLENDRISIYDYFILFPQELRKVSLPNELRAYKIVKIQNKYNEVKNSKTVYRRLKVVQSISTNNLITHGIINSESYKEDNLITTNELFDSISIDVLSDVEKRVFELITNYFNTLSLKDLKERTKLTEHRYEHS